MASYAEELIKIIDWSCTLILTDISHRILKYDKKYLEEILQNPNVKIIYLACDALHLPFKNNSIDFVTSFGGFENYNDSSMSGIIEAYRIIKPLGNCIYQMSVVEDKNASSTKKWLHLIEINDDVDAPALLESIFDINEWKKINSEAIGFKSCSITKLIDEAPAPATNKFPYDYEVMRWMTMTVICGKK